MNLDIEDRFLSRIWQDGIPAVDEAMESGITRDHFSDPEFARVWEFAVDYRGSHDALPSSEDVQFQCDTDWVPERPAPDALGRCIELLKKNRSYGLFVAGLAEARPMAQSDPGAAWAVLDTYKVQADEQSGILKPTNVHEGWADWFDAWMANTGVTGIPTGFPTIDYATGGYQPEQLVTIVGPPKAGKSSLMLKLAMEANKTYGKRVYMATFEMSADEQRRRLACMLAEVDYQRFLQKTLRPTEVARMRKALAQYEEVMPDFHIATDTTAGSTVGALAAQVRKFDPAVVFVDGVYLMDAEVDGATSMDPRSLTALTRNLKRMAQQLKVPVVISHQVLESRYSKRAGIRSSDIGYSSSFAQDSDVILGIERTEVEKEARLSIVLARNASQKSTMLAWDWEISSFEEIEGYGETDPDEASFEEWSDDDD